jgi:hypothetical protein
MLREIIAVTLAIIIAELCLFGLETGLNVLLRVHRRRMRALRRGLKAWRKSPRG